MGHLCLRFHLARCQRVILATAILRNIALTWGADDDWEAPEPYVVDDAAPPAGLRQVVGEAQMRREGQQIRENLKNGMPQLRTEAERRRHALGAMNRRQRR